MVTWRKTLVLTALLLIPIHIQCLIACGMPAPTAAACHHHRGHSDKQSPAPCAAGFMAGTIIFHAPDHNGAAIPMFLVSQATPTVNSPVYGDTAVAPQLSPPGSLLVLKI